MKKIISILLMFLISLSAVACTNSKSDSSNIEGSLPDIMAKIYKGTENNSPKLMQTEVTSENLSYYLGIETLDFKEALASEPMMTSIAHSVVLVRVNDGVDIEKIKTEIKEKVDPRKWICVGVEDNNVIVDSVGDLIVLIMDNENPDTLYKNFKNLSK
jgi:Domain of unknown function (DUF4358)